MGKAKKECEFPGCIESPGENEGFCDEHYERWRHSDAWREAMNSEKVRGWFQLGLKDMGMKELGKARRRWAKREADSGR